MEKQDCETQEEEDSDSDKRGRGPQPLGIASKDVTKSKVDDLFCGYKTILMSSSAADHLNQGL